MFKVYGKYPYYKYRHYWLYGKHGKITDCQTGSPHYDHRFIPIEIDNTLGIKFRSNKRRQMKQKVSSNQYLKESKVGDDTPSGRESLRIVQLTSIDAGMAVFRLHTALNSTSPHESVMASSVFDRPYEEPYQWNLKKDRDLIRQAIRECDISHCDLSYHHLGQLGTH